MAVQMRKKKNFYKVNDDLQWWILRSGYLEKILSHYPDKTKEDCHALLELAGEVAGEECASRISENDQYGEKNHSLAPGIAKSYQTLVDTGFLGLTLKKGLNFPIFTSFAVYELIAQADPALMIRYGLSDGVAETIERFGNEKLQSMIPKIVEGREIGAMVLTEPDAGSDLRNIKTKATATPDGIFLDGNKQFISNCDASLHLVLARDADGFHETMGTMKGLSMYLVSTAENQEAVQNTKREDKVGIHASLTGPIYYTSARAHLVGKKGAGLEQMLHLMYAARLGVTAQAVGTAQAAVVEAGRYAKERHLFGKALQDLPAMKNILDDISLTLLGMRSLLYEAAYCVEMKEHHQDEKERKRYEQRATMLTFLSKYYAAEECIRICRLALQVHGGNGFMKEYLTEQFLRDSLIFPIYEGTSQIQALSFLRETAKQGWKKALVSYADGVLHAFSPDRNERLLGGMKRMIGSSLYRLGKLGREDAQYHAERFIRIAANYEMTHHILTHPSRPRYEELRNKLLPRLLASSRKEYDELMML